MVQIYWKRNQMATTETHFLLITKPELCVLTNYHLLSRVSPIMLQLCFPQLLFCFHPWDFSRIPLKLNNWGKKTERYYGNKRKKNKK